MIGWIIRVIFPLVSNKYCHSKKVPRRCQTYRNCGNGFTCCSGCAAPDPSLPLSSLRLPIIQFTLFILSPQESSSPWGMFVRCCKREAGKTCCVNWTGGEEWGALWLSGRISALHPPTHTHCCSLQPDIQQTLHHQHIDHNILTRKGKKL